MISDFEDENERQGQEDLMRAFLRRLLFKTEKDIDIDIVDINMSNVNVCMLN